MSPESEDRIAALELRLDADEEKLFEHDRSLRGMRNLLKTGIAMLVSVEEHHRRLTDSEVRLYASVQDLTGKVQDLTDKVQDLTARLDDLTATVKILAESQITLVNAQIRTEELLQRLLRGDGAQRN